MSALGRLQVPERRLFHVLRDAAAGRAQPAQLELRLEVAVLGALDLEDGVVVRVVDINPHKAGHYLPGTGQEVVLPAALADDPPSLVVVMNPIYRKEIAADLEGMGLRPVLLAVGEDDPGREP